jgi:hypothetical protein
MWIWLAPVLLLVAVGVFVLVVYWRPLMAFGREVQLERARELFHLQRGLLQDRFLRAATATGKPRGLIWKECQWEGNLEFARDRHSGQIAALASVTIRFEAVVGGDMEGLPAVDNLRNASAVFFFHRGQWQTVGKAVFNMNPDEAIRHFQNQYERVGDNSKPA